METTFENYDGDINPKKRSNLSSFIKENKSFLSSSNEVDKFFEHQLTKSNHSDFFGLNPLSKTHKKIKTELLLQGAEAKYKTYNVLVEARLRLLKERAEAGIMIFSAASRQAVASVVLAKMEELNSDVAENQKRFIRKMEEHDEFAATIKDESRRKRYQRTIEIDEVRHFQFLDNVINKFQSILDETLSSYR